MQKLNEMREFIVNKTKENIKAFGDQLPTATEGGKYKFAPDGFWVGGFWNGILNLCWQMTGEDIFPVAGRRSWHRYVKRLYENAETLDHDVGFLYIPSFAAEYKLKSDLKARKIALDAADSLRGRFNEKGRFLQSWNVWKPGDPDSEINRGRIIIDSTYNLALLFWAWKETGDDEYMRVAEEHAETCAEYLVRDDYTTFHTYIFDPDTGSPRFGKTAQGYSDGSCWARGQAWAIGGYAYTARYSGRDEFLQLSRKLADVFIENLEEDHVAMWDFRLPSKAGEPRDTSATAIAAASMLELSELLPPGEASKYNDMARIMIDSLYDRYSSRDMPGEQGLLLHGCGHKPAGADIDVSLIYGDYFFTEAVARLLGKTEAYW